MEAEAALSEMVTELVSRVGKRHALLLQTNVSKRLHRPLVSGVRSRGGVAVLPREMVMLENVMLRREHRRSRSCRSYKEALLCPLRTDLFSNPSHSRRLQSSGRCFSKSGTFVARLGTRHDAGRYFVRPFFRSLQQSFVAEQGTELFRRSSPQMSLVSFWRRAPSH
jgi:hypothetical protein